jgi:hypothetical protein
VVPRATPNLRLSMGTPLRWPASCLTKPDTGGTRSSGHVAALPPRTTCLTARAKTASSPTAPEHLWVIGWTGRSRLLPNLRPRAGNRLGSSTWVPTQRLSSQVRIFRLECRGLRRPPTPPATSMPGALVVPRRSASLLSRMCSDRRLVTLQKVRDLRSP